METKKYMRNEVYEKCRTHVEEVFDKYSKLKNIVYN